MKFILNTEAKYKKWEKYVKKIEIEKNVSKIFEIICKVLKVKIPNTTTVDVSIDFISDKQIQKINKQYRNIDKSTNVLSFPIYEKEFFDIIKTEKYIVLGNIFLSLDTLLKECKTDNIAFDYHLYHLITHSILHLIGFDHTTENEAKEMEQLEKQVLQKFLYLSSQQ